MRKGFTVFAAAIAASLVATPMVISASNALATADTTGTVAATVAVTPVEVAPVRAAPAASLPGAQDCRRKVRVVYTGYGSVPAACVASAQ